MTKDEHKTRILAIWRDRNTYGLPHTSIGKFLECYNANHRMYDKSYKLVKIEEIVQ
jgi:hypothetical protein